MKDNIVEIKFNDVYWNVTPIEIEESKTNKKLIRLEWGWGSGMTDEERIEHEKEGIPAGYESVTTTLDGAVLLINDILEILEKNKTESKLVEYFLDHIQFKT